MTDLKPYFDNINTAEAEVQRVLADAMNEATALRKEAQALLELSRAAAAEERAKTNQKALTTALKMAFA